MPTADTLSIGRIERASFVIIPLEGQRRSEDGPQRIRPDRLGLGTLGARGDLSLARTAVTRQPQLVFPISL